MIEKYAIRFRTGRAVATEEWEKMRNGKMRRKTIYEEEYLTKGGEVLNPKEWKDKALIAAEEDGLLDLLNEIKNHCGEHCAWLHTKDEIEEHALECLASGAYLHWREFRSDGHRMFRFDFEEGSVDIY